MESSSLCALQRGEASGSFRKEPTGAIDSNNKGFQLLKKHGWKEGTGLGVTEQGRLEPVQAYWKNNKSGIGADEGEKTKPKLIKTSRSNGKDDKERLAAKKLKKRTKAATKRDIIEKQLQEKEFEKAFFREFWPDNV